MFASVEKNWIIERAGHGSDTLAAFIATYEGLIPKEATAREYGHVSQCLFSFSWDSAYRIIKYWIKISKVIAASTIRTPVPPLG